MDGKQHNALQPFDEAWFDVANSCGKEFELPNISTPINPQWSDNENLVFLEDQQPDILVNNYELVMTSSSCSGNVVDSFPPLKMVPAITNYVPTVDMQKGSYPPVNDEEIRSFITDSPAFLRNVSLGRWNQVAYVLVMTNIYQGSDGDINHFPNHLQSVRHSTGITSNVYQPCRSKQKPASQSQIESSNALERRVNSRKNVEPGH
ncbi:PREDICTED: LOC109948556 isoform X2 [Prunus dulcis]|uniref:PREDICTED: LOC109948556 isoform X2 n=1 Tax=Prunus dulcis TaxID=3755 RepID=A0A5E4G072_PRUDU|nr:PREDICTED: LOC109948556 isoform X2 [Prunus dulcis]